MKAFASILIAIGLIVTTFSSKAQSIKQDPVYLKQLNFLWGITSSFASVRSECNSRSIEALQMKQKQIKIISDLLKRSEAGFLKLKSTYPGDSEIVELGNARTVLSGALASLQDTKAQGPPMWQFNYVLVQLSLQDRLTE